MFIHSVYFWLKPDLTAQQRDQFWAGVKALGGIPGVRFFFIGSPAETDRPVIDRSYSCALITGFDDLAGHDAYQVHPIHDRFRELSHLWDRVQIYDATEH
ncbi:MAG: Dabb family protein [Terricaulis silvestris]